MFAHSTAIMLCTFAAATAGAYVVFTLFDPYAMSLRRRMRSMPSGRFEQDEETASPRKVASWLNRLSDIGIDREADRKRIVERLANAGFYHPSAASWFFGAKLLLLAIPVGATMIVSAAGWLPWGPALPAGLAIAAVASLAPNMWLASKVKSRHHRLRRALPDVLDLMIVCLEGGLSLPETVRRVAEELQIAHPDLAAELRLVQRDIDLGSTIEQALRRFATRSNFEGVRTLSTFVRESQRFGTRLTEALRNHADLLRSQREQMVEEQARQASVKILLPMMLLILPAIFVVLVAPAVIQIHEAFGQK